jgi:hypothetical protein
MPEITVDWSKHDESKPVTGLIDASKLIILPQSPRIEGGCVLHATRVRPPIGAPFASSTAGLCAIVAVALAEVNTAEAARLTVYVHGRDSREVVKVRGEGTRLCFRSGESILLLHPFEEIEPLFTAYRSRP